MNTLDTMPSALGPVAALPTETSTPRTAPTFVYADSPNMTILFGVLGLGVAIIGIGVALLQLRHMARRKMDFEIYELA